MPVIDYSTLLVKILLDLIPKNVKFGAVKVVIKLSKVMDTIFIHIGIINHAVLLAN